MSPINYNDSRFSDVEAEKQSELNKVNDTYNSMINQSDNYYQEQKNATKDYADTQQKIQQDNTNLAIEQVNQSKEQTTKDYTKEQSGAYVDWQKQSNKYGANAETMATQGMNNAGYSESSQVGMYNQYQNRVSTARDVYNRAVLNYDNSIKEAQLANNSKLAEIAYNALQTQLELSLQGFQYKNTLLQTQLQQQQQTKDRYNSRWQDVQTQINTENQLAESVRQYNQNYSLQQAQLAEEKRQYDQNYKLQQAQLSAAKSVRKSSSGGTSSNTSSSINKTNNSQNNVNKNNASTPKVKLSNGKTGYATPMLAYMAAGGRRPLNDKGVEEGGYVKGVIYNNKIYYYATGKK